MSPDGKNIAFIEGLMSDEGATGGDIYTIPITGGAARNLTPSIHSSPSALAWTSPDHITFIENVDGNSGFGSVTTQGAVQTFWTGEELARPAGDFWISAASLGKNAPVTALLRQSASAPPELCSTRSQLRQPTRVNTESARMGEPHVTKTDGAGRDYKALLLFPRFFQACEISPCQVLFRRRSIQQAASPVDEAFRPTFGPAIFKGAQIHAAVMDGGESFTQANVKKDFGGGDYRDIMAGVDAISKQFPIDTKRIGIRGHSYGGYMTMWAETQTQRFAAAVAGAGLSDWLSYYGLNDIDEWMIPFFGASIYDDPAVYAKSDPMHFIKAVKTPTLILVGDSDGEVPMEQSVEWWHALDTLHVPTKLVVYPNEGHFFIKSADARDYTLRSLEWFEEWFAKAQ